MVGQAIKPNNVISTPSSLCTTRAIQSSRPISVPTVSLQEIRYYYRHQALRGLRETTIALFSLPFPPLPALTFAANLPLTRHPRSHPEDEPPSKTSHSTSYHRRTLLENTTPVRCDFASAPVANLDSLCALRKHNKRYRTSHIRDPSGLFLCAVN